MDRFRRALSSARERVACFIPRTRRIPNRASIYMQATHSGTSLHACISSQEAAAALAPVFFDQTNENSQYATSIPLTIIHKVPAASAITTQAAYTSDFSHGTGLLVYVNGALISAACVALRINAATLELVQRLPLDQREAISLCLAAAFADTGSHVKIAWAEVCDNTERDWREAEQNWEVFSGGPYEDMPLEEYL
jgi:hypothetical protein